MTLTKSKTSNDKKGLILAFTNVIPYSIIPLIFLINFPALGGTSAAGFTIGASMAKGAVNVVCKDLMSLVLFSILIMWTRRSKYVAPTIKSRAGVYAMLSGIFGGPVGYVLFNSAFYLAGPSYAHVFSSFEPVILVIYAMLIWKRKFKWQVYFGIALSVLGVIASIAGESIITKSVGGTLAGALLAVGGAAAWAIESILMDRAFTIKSKDTNTLDLLHVKMLAAIFFNVLVMFPLTGWWFGDATAPFKAFGSIFTHMDYLWRFFLVGILIAVGRAAYFTAMKYQGSTVTAIIYETSVVLTPLIALTWWGITGYYPGGHAQLGWLWQTVFWVTSSAIITGALLAAIYRPKLDRIKEQKEVK